MKEGNAMKKNSILLKGLVLLEGILIVGLLCYVGCLNGNNTAQFNSTPTIIPAVPQKEQYIEAEIFRIANEGLVKYRRMLSEYFMTNLQTKEILTEAEQRSINGVNHYFLVIDDRYHTIQSVKNYVETICTKEYAEKLYKEQWDLEGACPFLAELNGELYTQVADAPFAMGNLYIPIAYVDDEGDIVFFYKCIHEEDSEYEWIEEGIMILEKQNDIWYVKSVEEWK